MTATELTCARCGTTYRGASGSVARATAAVRAGWTCCEVVAGLARWLVWSCPEHRRQLALLDAAVKS